MQKNRNNPAVHRVDEAERALEWINLVLGIFCIGVTVFLWITSPRPAGGDSRIVTTCALFAIIALPLLLVTSVILLFTNRQRAALGFGALLISVITFSQSTVSFH